MQITQAELEVMNVLWRSPNIGATEVAAALDNQTDWNIRTVKTLLARLVEKGALTTTPDGRRFLYVPAVSQKAYRAEAAASFIDKVFSGRTAPLVAQLADSKGLSKEDIAELEALLGRLKK